MFQVLFHPHSTHLSRQPDERGQGSERWRPEDPLRRGGAQGHAEASSGHGRDSKHQHEGLRRPGGRRRRAVQLQMVSIKFLASVFILERTFLCLLLLCSQPVLYFLPSFHISTFIYVSFTISSLRYHESVKDNSLVVTPWTEMPSQLGFGREIKFFKV